MKSENELITIGMPVFNGEKNLKDAIASILSQSYSNLELIIADDNSTDKSRQIYEEYSKKDKRIKIFRHKKNIGFTANFNFVLKKANSAYFLWAAQDDLRDTYALQELINLFKKYSDAILAVSNYKNLYKNKKYFVYPQGEINNNQDKIESIEYFLKTNNLSFFYGLHKTAYLKKSGGYLEDSRPFYKSSDFLTIFKLLLQGKFVYTSKVLFLKRDTGYFTKQYEVIEKMNFNYSIIQKIIRYFFSPIYYIYDLIYGTLYLSQSNLSLPNKFKIEIKLVINVISKFYIFIKNIFIGIIAFIKGVIKLLIKF